MFQFEKNKVSLDTPAKIKLWFESRRSSAIIFALIFLAILYTGAAVYLSCVKDAQIILADLRTVILTIAGIIGGRHILQRSKN